MTADCLGLAWAGACSYDPASPPNVYFTLGDAIAALAFTLAVQQFLKPIYRFRLNARKLGLAQLYGVVFLPVGCTAVAALVPQLTFLHYTIFGYALFWELLATVLFGLAYLAVVLAIVRPVKVSERSISSFARGAANLLSSASEGDHVDFLPDLSKSLPRLVMSARFVEHDAHFGEWSAFYEFTHRERIEQGHFAHNLLRILADSAFCRSLVTRVPWQVASVLQSLGEGRIYARSAEVFIQELSRQALLNDDGMIAKEVEYFGFGSAPVLSDSLYGDPYIVDRYDPLGGVYGFGQMGGPLLKRINFAARCCLETLIAHRLSDSSSAASIKRVYESAFHHVGQIRDSGERDFDFSFEMIQAVRQVGQLAARMQASFSQRAYDHAFLEKPDEHRYDGLQGLVDIAYGAVAAVANDFKGTSDPFWSLCPEFFRLFEPYGTVPNGMTPFQQRLALKLVDDVAENMKGYYPATTRVVLLGLGPYGRRRQPNASAFSLLQDAAYQQLRLLPKLAASAPEKVADYLPPSVTYEVDTKTLTWTYRAGSTASTKLTSRFRRVSLFDPAHRRGLTPDERTAAAGDYY